MATHGRSKSRLYNAWTGMITRCKNPKVRAFKWYGAKGIRVCKRWHKFENFLADMGELPTPKHTIDRINTRGDYEPGNCRYVTMKEQANNRTNNRLISAFGKTQTLQKWADDYGLPRDVISKRLRRNWPTELAIATELRSLYGLKPIQRG